MPEQNPEDIKDLLQQALSELEHLHARLEAGEDVSDEERTKVARAVAEAIEDANAKLKEMVGPMDSALLRERMVERMTPEEFEDWSEDNAALQAYRAEQTQQKEQHGG